MTVAETSVASEVARQSRREIVSYFERLAPMWDSDRGRNAYYHKQMRTLVRGMVCPNSDVLDLGCGTGDLLAELAPRRGLGLNVAEPLTKLARQRHPELEFETTPVDRVHCVHDFHPEYVVVENMLDFVYDLWEVVESLRSVMDERTLLVIITNNPLWAPIMALSSKLHLRMPDSRRNYITNRDAANVLRLHGFDVVEQGLSLPVPKRIPVIGTFLNALLPEIPLLRYTCSIQYIAARLRVPRQPLSCSVVIPCYNEEDNIAECIRRLPGIGTSTEIVVADDGSTDETRARVLEVMRTDDRVRLISTERNQGKAEAVWAGFKAARGDVLMILDADMAVPPEELPKFLKPLQDGSADFVNGTRLIYPMRDRAMKMFNYLGNRVFCYLVSQIFHQRVSDTLCGTKALLRRDYERMLIRRKERWGDFDLLFGAARMRLRLWEIPVHYQERVAGKSKMHVLVEVFRFLRACSQGWWMLRFPDRVPWEPQRKPTGWVELGRKGSDSS